MAIKRGTIGTAMTKRGQVEINLSDYSSAEEDREAINAAIRALPPPTLDGAIGTSERWAEAVLRKAGYEPPFRSLGRAHPAAYVSQVWYAAEVLDVLDDARRARARGDVDQAMFWSAQLGGLLKEADLKFRSETPRLEPLMEGNRARQSMAADEWGPWRERFQELIADGYDQPKAVRKICSERRVAGLSHVPRTVRRQVLVG